MDHESTEPEYLPRWLCRLQTEVCCCAAGDCCAVRMVERLSSASVMRAARFSVLALGRGGWRCVCPERPFFAVELELAFGRARLRLFVWT